MGKEKVAQTMALVVMLALYVGVRTWKLTATCLWFDEIFSIHAAEHSWKEIWQFVALDLIHPPLFYALLKVWIAICGESLWALRSMPAPLCDLPDRISGR